LVATLSPLPAGPALIQFGDPEQGRFGRRGQFEDGFAGHFLVVMAQESLLAPIIQVIASGPEILRFRFINGEQQIRQAGGQFVRPITSSKQMPPIHKVIYHCEQDIAEPLPMLLLAKYHHTSSDKSGSSIGRLIHRKPAIG